MKYGRKVTIFFVSLQKLIFFYMPRKLFLALLALISLSSFAQDKAKMPWRKVDAQDLRIINRGFPGQCINPYARIPEYLADSVRPTLYERSQHSAGIGVRFATDSRRIGVSYDLLTDGSMIHMASTGLKGVDLYILEADSVWRHMTCIRPYTNKDSQGNPTKHVEKPIVENLDGNMHEYMMYLPLYDGVTSFQVKVDSAANITSGNPDLISRRGRIVAYGTSILQGGCASRPGMASTNIISRELNREVINIGISGEGKMDACMARAMATIPDVDLFILDPVPNCTLDMCDSLTYDFVNIIRQARPDAAIVMVEGPIYPYARHDSYFSEYLPKKNEAFRRGYERLRAERPEGLYYVSSEGLDGPDDDGTVDGIHLTDLGFRHYADKLLPVLREALDEKGKE